MSDYPAFDWQGCAEAAEERIRELEAENKTLKRAEGHYKGCPLRVKLVAGVAPMCTPCTCDDIQQKRADKAALARAESAEAKLEDAIRIGDELMGKPFAAALDRIQAYAQGKYDPPEKGDE